MKATEILVIGISLLAAPAAFPAGGGSGFVGNGAGVVEQDAQFAYASLVGIVSQCLNDPSYCGVNEGEQDLLGKVGAIARSNLSNPERIVFKSELLNPGMFDTACDQRYRVAMTGLDTSHPIYMNTDKLYDREGSPAIRFASLVAILVHEVGHQTGEADHARLDVLGSKIAVQIQKAQDDFHFEFPGQGAGGVSVRTVNFGSPLPFADLYLRWNGVPAVKFTSSIRPLFRCSQPGMRLVGLGLHNGHWYMPAPGISASSEERTIGFAFWADLYCMDMTRKGTPVVTRENAELNLVLSNAGIVRQIQVTERK